MAASLSSSNATEREESSSKPSSSASRSNATNNGTASVPRPATSSTGRPRRRGPPPLFSIAGWRFRCSRDRLVDSVVDGISWAVEGLVYLIGPLLILLALSIMSLLTYSFATILVPMMQAKHAQSSYKNVYVGLHGVFVLFILVNILFNYFFCVTTRHRGPNYDKTVRDLAQATNLMYPETPAQLAQYRRDFEDRMVLRMRRRQARDSQQQPRSASSENSTAVVHRKNNNNNPTPPQSPTASTSTRLKPQPPLRKWMLMGPYEWGYCGNSNQPKPPRSHYDHVSKQLVLNLDHYCPWMFNAIGYFNYRYFVNFLFFICIGMLYGALVSFQPFWLLSSKEYKDQMRLFRQHKTKGSNVPFERLLPMLPFRHEKTLVSLSFMLCVAVGLAVLVLGSFHIYLTLTAQTTIEFHANFASRKRAKQSGKKWNNPYSTGTCRGNWEQVFGRLPWYLAILPSRREPEALPVPVPGGSNKVHGNTQATSSSDKGADTLYGQDVAV